MTDGAEAGADASAPSEKAEPPAPEIVYVEAPLPKTNPWKKPEQQQARLIFFSLQ